MVYQITDEELAQARAEINAMEIAAADRWERLVRRYGDDVRQLYSLTIHNTGAAGIAADLLHALHSKTGDMALFELRHLDPINRAAALRLIDCMATPSIIPDSGLTVGPEGEPLLSTEEVMVLMRAKRARKL